MSTRPSRSTTDSSKKYADFDFDDSGERKLAELEDSGSDFEDELKKIQDSKSNIVVKKVIKTSKKAPKKPKVEKPIRSLKVKKVKKALNKQRNDDIDYDQLWECSHCNYNNEKDKTLCSACETAKPSKAVEPTPAIASVASRATASSSKFVTPWLKTPKVEVHISGSSNYIIESDTGNESLAELKAQICEIEGRNDVFLFVAGKPVDYEMLVSSIGDSHVDVIVPLGGKVQESSARTDKVKGQNQKVKNPKVKNGKVKKVLNNQCNDDIDFDQPWECSHCTYINEKDKKICVACKTAKPSKAAQPTSGIASMASTSQASMASTSHASMASTSHAITGASLLDQEIPDFDSNLDQNETVVLKPNRSKKLKTIAQKSKIVIVDKTKENDENKENTLPSKSDQQKKKKTKDQHLCNDCGERFSRHERLIVHVNSVHLQLKPFKCDQCEVDYFAKLFSSDFKDLSLHMQEVLLENMI